MPMMTALDMLDPAGRFRSIGCSSSALAGARAGGGSTYLDNGEAQHGRGHVADKHAGEGSHEHVGQENGPRPRACLAQNKRSDALVDLHLGQGGGDGKASEKKHNDGRPHGGENGMRCFGRAQASRVFAAVFIADDSEDDGQEWDE